MRRPDNPQQLPRYDLYIVTENVGEDAEDGGHLNASYAASDPDTDPASSRRVSASGPEVEERLRVEITDEAVLGNGDLAPAPNTNTKTDKVDRHSCHSFCQFKKLICFFSAEKEGKLQSGPEVHPAVAAPRRSAEAAR